jgi:hypothetical protein
MLQTSSSSSSPDILLYDPKTHLLLLLLLVLLLFQEQTISITGLSWEVPGYNQCAQPNDYSNASGTTAEKKERKKQNPTL